MEFDLELVLAELKRRDPAYAGFHVDKFCFKEQLDFINDPARFKTAVCSRRSGKTISCAADLVRTALANPKRICVYITLSRLNAKRIIWSELIAINKLFDLGGKVNDTELSITFPNASIIYCTGAKDASEVEKLRGLPIALCYIDECQSFRSYIQTLVDDVISKALFDYNGTLCLIGTPGPVPVGYFYECSQSKTWAHHAWTMFENPHLEKKSGKTVQALVDEDIARKGVTIDDPTIQRECFGKWAHDPNALVFRFDRQKNSYQALPALAGRWHYIIGIDIGFDDADAIAVIAWNEKENKAYLVREDVEKKQGITELVNKVAGLIDFYDPMKVVMDTGGLGKKIAEEIRKRYGIPIQAAEKSRKFEYIELLNDAMRTGRFFAEPASRFAQDCMLVEWDRDSSQPKVSDRFHSDITDAVLYAFRESMHWIHEPEPIIHPVGSERRNAEIEREMEEAAIARLETEEDLWEGI